MNIGTHVPQHTAWQLRYWSIFTGQALSLIGSALTQFVLLWWITDTTNSVSALGMAGLAALLPQAVLGPLGGTFADRYNRRHIMMTADLIGAACMVVLIILFLTDTVALWHLYLMMTIRSAMQAFQQPAASASTAMLVPAGFISRAAGLNQSLFGIMTVGAAPLGALAISIMPIGWALGIDVITAILGIVPLLIYTIPQSDTSKQKRTSLWLEFREGVDTVWHNPVLRRLYGLMTVAVLIVMPLLTLVPLLVKGHFGGGATQVAAIESFGGMGMIAGGLLTAWLAPQRRILWILLGFAISNLSFALTAMLPSHLFWWGIVAWTVGSVAYVAGNAPFMALLQSTVPNHLQGRVLSLLATLTGLAAPLGLGLITLLGKIMDVQMLFIVLGVTGCLLVLLGFLSSTIRKADHWHTHSPGHDSRDCI